MEKKKTEERLTFRKQDRLGANDAAEDIATLSHCFVDTGNLAVLRDCQRPERIVLGRTGSGKTALLMRLLETEKRCVEIKPEALALSYISNSNIIRFFEGLGVHLDIFYKLIWRHAFCVELLRMRFNMSPGQKEVSLTEWLKSLFKGGQYSAAIKYLETWGDTFWETTEHRIKEITTKVETSLETALKGAIGGVNISLGGGESLSKETKAELVQRGQHVVNEAHAPQLNQLLELVRDVLDDPQKKYFLVIDRLDESWVDDQLRYKLIMALIETVRDFRKVNSAKIVISLRLDLIQRVFMRAKPPGFQEEKVDSLYLRMSWSKTQLVDLVNARVNFLFRDRYSEKRELTFEDVLVGAAKGDPPLDYMLARTLMRPRDIIAFFNDCIRAAEGKAKIGFKDVRTAELEYSRGRFQSVTEEWEVDFPNLAPIARKFLSRTRTPCQVQTLLDDDSIAARCLDISAVAVPPATDELFRACEAVGSSKLAASTGLRVLLSIFYRVGIVGLKILPTESCSWFMTSARSVDVEEILPTVSVEIHPIYWSALQIIDARAA